MKFQTFIVLILLTFWCSICLTTYSQVNLIIEVWVNDESVDLNSKQLIISIEDDSTVIEIKVEGDKFIIPQFLGAMNINFEFDEYKCSYPVKSFSDLKDLYGFIIDIYTETHFHLYWGKEDLENAKTAYTIHENINDHRVGDSLDYIEYK